MEKYVCFIDSPIGRIGIADNGVAVTNVFFNTTVRPTEYVERRTELNQRAATQLIEYFEGSRDVFDLPLAPDGTQFEREVWGALCRIPYGKTVSYGEIAKWIGRPKSARAVGGANGKNPIAIIIPCHRVIGVSGAMVGYTGGMDIKIELLRLESVNRG